LFTSVWSDDGNRIAQEKVSVVAETPADLADVAEDGGDLVVLDPGIGGEDPGGWFRQGLEHEAIGVPLVVCTGNTRILRDLADDLAERNIDVVPKPFAIDALLDVGAGHVGSSSAFG
jgi:DNA-binding NtrC family response regulator